MVYRRAHRDARQWNESSEHAHQTVARYKTKQERRRRRIPLIARLRGSSGPE